ncbi:Uncharacterised protein [Mycobacteroides abscessus subsp. abscessus]|nr:Uncharacterised protein [Mycobacteroides abscessus subsp. abscessus]
MATCPPAGADHTRACLPRPDVWSVVMRTVPTIPGSTARAARSALVDPVDSTTSIVDPTPLPGEPKRSTMAARSASASRGDRGFGDVCSSLTTTDISHPACVVVAHSATSTCHRSRER